MVPSTESAGSLHKPIPWLRLSFQYSHQDQSASPIGGLQPVEMPSQSTDSFRLEDSPVITALNFPSPPQKASPILAQYESRSQVTPPACRPVTPEQPTTPTMLSPETGRFQSSTKSYPSPVQAGFRSPSSRFGLETSGRRSLSGPSFQSARALDFDDNPTPTRLLQFPRDRSRSDSFGSTAEDLQRFMARTTAARMPDITEAGSRPERLSAYGFEVPDFAVNDFDPLSPTSERRIGDRMPNHPVGTAFQLPLELANQTPDLSLSDLVSSPPSVDTGADQDIVQTTLVTPEGRHFPNIYSPLDHSKKWAASGVIGLGEGIAGGPQRDERGRRINLRRWRKADPMLADGLRTAVDVYTNGEPEKQRTGFKKRFSQSVLNLLGESKKPSKNGQVVSPPQSKPVKKELRRSVTDLLGLSGRTRTYDWNQPQDSPGALVTAKQRLNSFKRSESTPINLSVAVSTGPSWLPFLQGSHRNLPSQETRKQISRLPASPSMPALSASLNRKASPDMRIQDWLNASQAALHDTQSSRYDFGIIVPSDGNLQYAIGPKSPSIASRILTRRPESRSETREESQAPILGSQVVSDEVPAVRHTFSPLPSGRVQAPAAIQERESRHIPVLDSAVDLPASKTDQLTWQKPSRRKRMSLSRFTSWLGFGEKNSKQYTAKESSAPEYVSARGTTSAIQHKSRPAELAEFSRQSAPSSDPSASITGGRHEHDSVYAKKRRSGGDWLGSVGWRRWENAPQAASMVWRDPQIVLLSAEHLPPPHINAQGFLQSTLTGSSNALPSSERLYKRFSVQGQTATADPPCLDPALLAPHMERDLSRLSERDEEVTGDRWELPAMSINSTAIPEYSGRTKRKPTPTAFIDTGTPGFGSLAAPPVEGRRRRPSKADEFGKILSITSMSSLSTDLAEGEDHAATIQTVLASPIHDNTPYPAPVVSRAVSLDLSALTDAERSAIGFQTVNRPVVAK